MADGWYYGCIFGITIIKMIMVKVLLERMHSLKKRSGSLHPPSSSLSDVNLTVLKSETATGR